MDDLISRQAAIDAVNNIMLTKEGFLERREVLEELTSLPSAQQKRQKGEWINDKGLYRCSECMELWTGWWAVIVPLEKMNGEMPYCPKCGAYLRGEQDE